jgi:hypothetical protein
MRPGRRRGRGRTRPLLRALGQSSRPGAVREAASFRWWLMVVRGDPTLDTEYPEAVLAGHGLESGWTPRHDCKIRRTSLRVLLQPGDWILRSMGLGVERPTRRRFRPLRLERRRTDGPRLGRRRLLVSRLCDPDQPGGSPIRHVRPSSMDHPGKRLLLRHRNCGPRQRWASGMRPRQ